MKLNNYSKNLFVLGLLCFACSSLFSMEDAPANNNSNNQNSNSGNSDKRGNEGIDPALLALLLGASNKNSNNDFGFLGGNVKAETPIKDVFKFAVKDGFRQSVAGTTRDMTSNMLRFLPDSISRLGKFISRFVYKLSFGSNGLTAGDLAKISNRIYAVCSPFSSVSAGNMDKKRRANLILQENGDEEILDTEWKAIQAELICELNHSINYIKKSLPCYNLLYSRFSKSGIRYKLASLMFAFSIKDSEQVVFYSLQSIKYIQKLIELFESYKSFDEAQQNHEEIKRWLNLVCNSFELVSQFLDDNKSSSNSGPAFKKMNSQNNGGMSGLEALLNQAVPLG